ncbi:MAG: heparan-alpha-glucosaminide N-acetyltransferase domain-containing protein, partial [Collinsella sp.]|nr:heparan-alpha-glucosaminide N-acetyltransferase domain-containing protein [Collinsella sp.]
TFLVLAGWMSVFSRSNLKRGALYAAVAGTIFLATTLVAVDAPISFGIMFCMAASTLIHIPLERIGRGIPPWLGSTLCIVTFILTFDLPRSPHPLPGLAWLGLPDATFSSGDYYPLLPYSLLYFLGAELGRWHALRHAGEEEEFPRWAYVDHVPALSWMGRHALPIYLAHQPIVLGLIILLLGG